VLSHHHVVFCHAIKNGHRTHGIFQHAVVYFVETLAPDLHHDKNVTMPHTGRSDKLLGQMSFVLIQTSTDPLWWEVWLCVA